MQIVNDGRSNSPRDKISIDRTVGLSLYLLSSLEKTSNAQNEQKKIVQNQKILKKQMGDLAESKASQIIKPLPLNDVKITSNDVRKSMN